MTLLALRHFVATELLDRGQSIKTAAARLGHRPSMTADTYAAAVPASDRAAADMLDDLLG